MDGDESVETAVIDSEIFDRLKTVFSVTPPAATEAAATEATAATADALGEVLRDKVTEEATSEEIIDNSQTLSCALTEAERKALFFNAPNTKEDPLKAFPKLLAELEKYTDEKQCDIRGRISQYIALAFIKTDLIEFLAGQLMSPIEYREVASCLSFSHTNTTRYMRRPSYTSEKLDNMAQFHHFGNFFHAFATHLQQLVHLGKDGNRDVWAYSLRQKPTGAQMSKYVDGIENKIDSLTMTMFTVLNMLETTSDSESNHLSTRVVTLVGSLTCGGCVDEVQKSLLREFGEELESFVCL
jgi:uncharacterized protein Yka (UPF0111/DUF47 family)